MKDQALSIGEAAVKQDSRWTLVAERDVKLVEEARVWGVEVGLGRHYHGW